MAVVAALLALSLADGPLESRSIAANHTASVLVERAIVLGIDFDSGNGKAVRPAVADVQALGQAAIGAWLEAQLEVPDDTIGEAPGELRSYLEARRDAISAITGALEREPPEWKESGPEVRSTADLLPALRLQKVLLANALVAARDGDSVQAERLLEASWSLGQPNAKSVLLIRRLIEIASGRWQVGVLRKLQEPSPVWISRLSEDRVWTEILGSFVWEMTPKKTDALKTPRHEVDLQPSEGGDELRRKAPEAIAAGLRKLGPCEGSNLDDEGYWKLVERELKLTSDPQIAEIRENFRDLILINMKDAFRRAGRFAVDQELTLAILRLRQAREEDPDGRWPERMENIISTVCPSFAYAYRSDSQGMEIRFDGTIADPSAPFLLPLSFRSSPPPPTPTPTPSPQ